MERWTQRRRNCSMTYYHPEIPWVIVHYFNNDEILFGGKSYESVDKAKQAAEKEYLK